MLGWSLRLRVFLFFAFLGLAGAAASLAGLWFAAARAETQGAAAGFALAAVLIPLVQVGLAAGIWLLFDENVARPIEALAAGMRARTHGAAEAQLDTAPAKYLGDLAPAADAVTRELGSATLQVAETVASETARLEAESQRLTALLTSIPVATVLLNAADEIVLYDGQAAACLAAIAPPRLKAPISDYFDLAPLGDAREAKGEVTDRRGHSLRLHRKPMEGGGTLLLLESARRLEERPLVYDFDLLHAAEAPTLEATPLDQLTYCVVDTETTGLDPARDALVQVAALRVVNGRLRADESLDRLVNPGCPIPAVASTVHGIHDCDVAGAPPPDEVAADLRAFCGSDVFVAHNAPFDLGMLRRTGDDWAVPVLDTVLLSAIVWGTTASHTLDALCDRLGVVLPPEVRHTAMGDTQATAEALVRLIPMLKARGLETFADVLAETRRHGRLLQDMNPA